MNKLPLLNIKRIIRAFSNSFEGLKLTLKTEVAFQQEIILAIIFIYVALLLDLNGIV
ncbi:MAG: hypothetical protein K0R12_429 [Gammaproteobacteria bacterium]|jgi:diacylglycerol kinase|nr:hypothetical protein [Gammaproteobacteria bacterium]